MESCSKSEQVQSGFVGSLLRLVYVLQVCLYRLGDMSRLIALFELLCTRPNMPS
jgi:hypothetical protein